MGFFSSRSLKTREKYFEGRRGEKTQIFRTLVSIATVYIIDYHARQDSNENSVLSVTLQNESHIFQETIEVFEHENDITKAAQTVASLTSVMTTMVRNQF